MSNTAARIATATVLLVAYLMLLAGCGRPESGSSGAADRTESAGVLADASNASATPDCDDLPTTGAGTPPPTSSNPHTDMPKTDAEWREKLTPLQYRVLRHEGTEPAGTGEYLHHTDDGVYRCAGCGAPLYDSDTKFPDHGWPAFTDAIPGSVATRDVGPGTREVHCANCGGHLGHIFMDGPGPRRTRH